VYSTKDKGTGQSLSRGVWTNDEKPDEMGLWFEETIKGERTAGGCKTTTYMYSAQVGVDANCMVRGEVGEASKWVVDEAGEIKDCSRSVITRDQMKALADLWEGDSPDTHSVPSRMPGSGSTAATGAASLLTYICSEQSKDTA